MRRSVLARRRKRHEFAAKAKWAERNQSFRNLCIPREVKIRLGALLWIQLQYLLWDVCLCHVNLTRETTLFKFLLQTKEKFQELILFCCSAECLLCWIVNWHYKRKQWERKLPERHHKQWKHSFQLSFFPCFVQQCHCNCLTWIDTCLLSHQILERVKVKQSKRFK